MNPTAKGGQWGTIIEATLKFSWTTDRGTIVVTPITWYFEPLIPEAIVVTVEDFTETLLNVGTILIDRNPIIDECCYRPR